MKYKTAKDLHIFRKLAPLVYSTGVHQLVTDLPKKGQYTRSKMEMQEL